MPEMPEMETYKKLLTPRIVGAAITGVDVEREKSLNVDADTFARIVMGQSIERIERRGKHLIFGLGSGHELLLHLMLGGWMFYGTEEEKPERTVQVRLSFGERHLHFIGLRLGYLHLYTREEREAKLSKLGPEAVELSVADLARILKGKRGAFKPVFTDQQTMAGIGNCYADEICFAARVKPTRLCSSLEASEIDALHRATGEVVREAIDTGGYMEDPLFAGDRLTGGFNERCKVYDRGDEPCVRCGSPIVKGELNNRKVFYCANCQS